MIDVSWKFTPGVFQNEEELNGALDRVRELLGEGLPRPRPLLLPWELSDDASNWCEFSTDEIPEELRRVYHLSIPNSFKISIDSAVEAIAALERVEPESVEVWRVGQVGGPPVDEPGKISDQPKDWRSHQYYLDELHIEALWGHAGGLGQGVQLGVVETGLYPHELLARVISFQSPVNSVHGTATLGLTSAWHAAFGVRGIAPLAKSAVAAFAVPEDVNSANYSSELDRNVANALWNLVRCAEPGSIVLVEAEVRKRPNSSPLPVIAFKGVRQVAKWAVERRGVTVVVPAGNGGVSLDNVLSDDGGVLVVGFLSRNGDVAKKSNRGPAVFVYCWGDGLVTCAPFSHGNVHRRPPKNGQERSYRNDFGQTSGAAAIIAGCLAGLSGSLKHQNRPRDPTALRHALKEFIRDPLGWAP